MLLVKRIARVSVLYWFVCEVASKVKKGVWSSFTCINIVPFNIFSLKSKRVTSKVESNIFCCKDTESVDMSIRAASYLTNVKDRRTKFSPWYNHRLFFIDLHIRNGGNTILMQRAVIVSYRPTIVILSFGKATNSYIRMCYQRVSQRLPIKFSFMHMQSTGVEQNQSKKPIIGRWSAWKLPHNFEH